MISFGLPDRQPYAESGAFADFALHFDASVMFLQDAIGQRQAQSCTIADRLGSEEWIEDLLEMFRRDTLAGIDDIDSHIIALASATDSDAAVFFYSVRGINQQIHEHLVQLRG